MRTLILGLLCSAAFISAPASADLPPRMTCVADGAYFTWYGTGLGVAKRLGISTPDQTIGGSPASDPKTRLRTDGMKAYLSDGDTPEYIYGDLKRVGPDRYTAGYMVLMLGEGNLTAVAVIADPASTHTVHFKCVPG